MRLLIMSDGGSVHTERWCDYFESQGYITALFSLEPITISSQVRTFQGKRITGRGLIDYSLAIKHFHRVVEEFKPNCINAHFAASYGWLASHVDGCPVITTVWGSDVLILPHKSMLHRNRVKRSLAIAAACTVDGKGLAKEVGKYVPTDKIHRIVMGVDENLLLGTTGQQSDDGKIRIIAPRGLQDVYDPKTIIDAIGLLQEPSKFAVTLRGDGDLAARYEEIICQKSLSDIITIQRRLTHDDYISLLASHDIYLSASLSDSTSVSLLEAMALGLYPIVSDIDGNREWITDGRNGLLFDTKNPQTLADAIQRAIAQSESFDAVAAANRQLIEKEGIWQRNMARMERLIEGIVV
ncbi:MAG: glycosyltransferase family 4 protein [Candidatus Zixiibacteriota bacterium]